MSKIKKMLKSWRVLLLLFFLAISLISLSPRPGNEGVVIRSVIKDSAAYNAGILGPEPTTQPLNREKVVMVNNQVIKNQEDYYAQIQKLVPNQTVPIKTDRGLYYATVLPKNGSLSEAEDIGLRISNAPTSNLRKGLDLQGGTRVLLEPDKELSPQDMDFLIGAMKQRLNVYGLSDLIIKPITDRPGIVGQGKTYIQVEIAGATEEEVKDLLAKQGKFESKIGNKSVFLGGEDIKAVCRSPECARIETCSYYQDGYICRFSFSITLSLDAAQKQADATKDLQTVVEGNEEFLNETLDLYLDDSLVDSLRIAADLRGRAATDIQISGSGAGKTEAEAAGEAQNSMKKLQTVLITGSLPVKLEIVKIDTLSPSLGEEFISNILFVAGLAIIAVGIVVFLRYRRLEVSLPIIVIMVSEVVILLGIAALIRWNLDLAAIAGILVATGTGVDDQIVIADEALRGQRMEFSSWKQRIQRAFYIIFAAWFVTVFSMIPLYFAGAGLLRGFAITTIIGVTVGVLITRPAYAAISEILLNK